MAQNCALLVSVWKLLFLTVALLCCTPAGQILLILVLNCCLFDNISLFDFSSTSIHLLDIEFRFVIIFFVFA